MSIPSIRLFLLLFAITAEQHANGARVFLTFLLFSLFLPFPENGNLLRITANLSVPKAPTQRCRVPAAAGTPRSMRRPNTRQRRRKRALVAAAAAAPKRRRESCAGSRPRARRSKR